MKNLLSFTILLMMSCTNHENHPSDFIFIAKDSNWRIDFCYLMDGKIQSRYMDGYLSTTKENLDNRFIYNPESNTVFDSVAQLQYYPLKCTDNLKYDDTIIMANSINGLTQGIGAIFNARIINKYWQVGIYYPYNLIGTYEFRISKSEMNLFQCAMQRYLNETPLCSDTNYFQKDTSELLVNFSNRKPSTVSNLIADKTCTSLLLNDLTTIIIKNHLQKHNKISNEVLFGEIRTQFKNDVIKPVYEPNDVNAY